MNEVKDLQSAIADLSDVFGTGEDTKGLIGKKVRVTRTEIGLSGDVYYTEGDVAVVVHIGGDGSVWADFEDQGNAEVNRNNPSDRAVWCVGDDAFTQYEIVE